jgi:phospholipid/cholesterol/gamma-HCH transport system ATP-binding protein
MKRAMLASSGAAITQPTITSSKAVGTIRGLIRKTNDELGLTSIVVTHNVEQMKKLVDYCFIIAQGRIAGQGHPDELSHSSDPAVDQFMNGKVDGPIPFRFTPATAGAAP